MKQCGIYSITCQVNGKRYIGSSSDINYRWQQHRAMLRHNRHYNRYLQRAWHKHGESAFLFEIIELTTEEARLERETHWIAHYLSCHKTHGYNDTAIGNVSRLSDEALARMAEKKRGSKHSPETRAKMSASRRGHTVSAETRAKLSAIHSGRKLKPDQVEKMRQRALGKSPSAETRAKLSAANKKPSEAERMRQQGEHDMFEDML